MLIMNRFPAETETAGNNSTQMLPLLPAYLAHQLAMYSTNDWLIDAIRMQTAFGVYKLTFGVFAVCQYDICHSVHIGCVFVFVCVQDQVFTICVK